MTPRRTCPPAPAPLAECACQLDALFATLAPRRGWRVYLEGLLAPRDRDKTLTTLAAAAPVVGAPHPAVQGLQCFLSEPTWQATARPDRRLALRVHDPVLALHAAGVLGLDASGDRKAGRHTAQVARQNRGSVGKGDNGIVAISTLGAGERVYYPLHVQPYTPASRFPRRKLDPVFRTKPQLAVALVAAAVAAGVPFRAAVAGCAYGDSDAFQDGMWEAPLPYVLALKPSQGTWGPAEAAHSPEGAARRLRWNGPQEPVDWRPLVRRFRDGHRET